jgi:Zeta toxin.
MRAWTFPGPLEQPLDLVGSMVAARAIAESRNIVTEIIGADLGATSELTEALRSIGYSVEAVAITCELEESIRWNEERGDSVSAYCAEPFQRRWIIDACRKP